MIYIVDKTIVNNDCYKNNINGKNSTYTNFQINGASGGMLHSAGCNQSRGEVFYKQMNQPNVFVAVHAIIQPDGYVLQFLPWNFKGWHSGKDVTNNTLIGVEMTEPDCLHYTYGDRFFVYDEDKEKAIDHVKKCYEHAVELFAMLTLKFDWNPMLDIVSHCECGKSGTATPHSDPEHLWEQLGLPYTMDTFRRDVKNYIEKTNPDKELYRIRLSWENDYSQIGAFSVLDYAIDYCPVGYKVFDSKGNVVYDNSGQCENCPYRK